MDIIIENPGRLHSLVWMLLFLQFYCSIEIGSQLKLQSIVQGGQVKTGISCLVINDFYIDFLPCLVQIHPVNTPPWEIHLKSCRDKISPHHLFFQSPHRAAQNPLHPGNHIFIAGAAVQNGAAVIRSNPVHTFINQLPLLFLCQIHPGNLPPPQVIRIQLQSPVHHSSQIHGLEFIIFPLPQSQTISHIMGKSTGSKLFQPGGTEAAGVPVENLCRTFPDPLLGRLIESRLHPLPGHLPVTRLTAVPVEQFPPACILPAFCQRGQSPDRQRNPPCRPFQKTAVVPVSRRVLHSQSWEKPAQAVNEIGRPAHLPLPVCTAVR